MLRIIHLIFSRFIGVVYWKLFQSQSIAVYYLEGVGPSNEKTKVYWTFNLGTTSMYPAWMFNERLDMTTERGWVHIPLENSTPVPTSRFHQRSTLCCVPSNWPTRVNFAGWYSWRHIFDQSAIRQIAGETQVQATSQGQRARETRLNRQARFCGSLDQSCFSWCFRQRERQNACSHHGTGVEALATKVFTTSLWRHSPGLEWAWHRRQTGIHRNCWGRAWWSTLERETCFCRPVNKW